MASSPRFLTVWMNGEHAATWSRPNGGHELTYEPLWVASAQGRPLSLSLPFVPGNIPHRGDKVRMFFENLLPDRPEVRNRLRDRFGASSAQGFELLAEIGRDCVGAIQLLRPEDDPPQVQAIKGVPLSQDEMSRQLDIAGGLNLPGFDRKDFRISLAGAQEKTAFLWHQGQWQKPLGSTPSTHIFKLPLGRIGGLNSLGAGSVENEWLCSRIVQGYGLPIAETQMLAVGSNKVLVVKRFDRRLATDGSWWVRIPVEDFCQANGLPSEKKYESDGGPGIDRILTTLEGSQDPHVDRVTFLKAQIVFWLLAASDGHAKNVSIFLSPKGTYKLTPLYDVLSMYPWIGTAQNQLPLQKLKMAMAVRGKNPHYLWSSIYHRHWESVAVRNGLGKDFTIIISELIDRTPQVIKTVSAELPADFPSSIAESVFQGMTQAIQRLL
jgi:serine/threonine-protein kinase HipA